MRALVLAFGTDNGGNSGGRSIDDDLNLCFWVVTNKGHKSRVDAYYHWGERR
jgi:hypothetical protein